LRACPAEGRPGQGIKPGLADGLATAHAGAEGALIDPLQRGANLGDLGLPGVPRRLKNLITLTLGGEILPVAVLVRIKLFLDGFQTGAKFA
jgi:hypothetical protein